MADFDAVSGGLLDSAMSTAQIGGHFYGLALNTNTKILFYNQKALEDAGLPVPADMDEFVDTVKALSGTNENGQQVWGYNATDPGRLEPVSFYLELRRGAYRSRSDESFRLY